MSDDLYFVISNTDGDTTVRVYDYDSMKTMLNDPDEGPWLRDALDDIPNVDTNYWGCKPFIIRGDVAKVKSVVVETHWDLA